MGALPVGVGLGVGAGGAACAVCLGAAPARVTRAGFGLWPVKFLDMTMIWRRTRGVPRFEAFAALAVLNIGSWHKTPGHKIPEAPARSR